MLNQNQINQNKERFISLLRSIKRQNSDIEGLINKLENSDFFTAPASTQYHCNYVGGLCEHSLNVYDQLVKLINLEYPRFIPDSNGEMIEVDDYKYPFDQDSAIIVGLLHDISKMNYYEVAERNAKDESGNWIKVPYIKTRDARDRFIYSSHGVNSEYMIGRFIPLYLDESIAIINHMGGKEAGNSTNDSTLSEIFNRYPLAILTHAADMLATFFVEYVE